jgi:hypothetical protein
VSAIDVAPLEAVVNTHSWTGAGAAVVVALAIEGIATAIEAAPAVTSQDIRGLDVYIKKLLSPEGRTLKHSVDRTESGGSKNTLLPIIHLHANQKLK